MLTGPSDSIEIVVRRRMLRLSISRRRIRFVRIWAADGGMSSVMQERIRLGVVDILHEAAARRNWRLATDAVQVTGMLTSRGEEIHLGVPLTFLHHCMGSVNPCNRARSVSTRGGLFLLRVKFLVLHIRVFPSVRAFSDAEIQDFSR